MVWYGGARSLNLRNMHTIPARRPVPLLFHLVMSAIAFGVCTRACVVPSFAKLLVCFYLPYRDRGIGASSQDEVHVDQSQRRCCGRIPVAVNFAAEDVQS